MTVPLRSMQPMPVARDSDGRQLLGEKARTGTESMRARSSEVVEILGKPSYFMVFAIYPGDEPGNIEITCDEFSHPGLPAESVRLLKVGLVAPRLQAEVYALLRENGLGERAS